MNTFKMIKNFLIRYHKRLLSAVIVVVFGFVLLASSLYNVKLEDGSYKKDDWTSAPYVASTYTEQSSVSDNGITTEQSAQELWDKMIEEGSNIEDYLDTPEELEKLMNAEIITQYPKIGKDNLDGIIQFERHKTDGTSNMLTYIDNETFNNYINSGDEAVLDYFTLDDQKNALVAVMNTTTETITSNDDEISVSDYTQNLDESNKKSDGSYEKKETIITPLTINYKNYVQNYTMPFQYLWALLVIGEDKDFVLELADLVEDSEITISIYDNITTIENVTDYKYKKETRTDKYAKISVEDDYGATGYATERYWVSSNSPEPDVRYYNSRYEAAYNTDETDYTVTDKVTSETNSPIVGLTKANVWIVDYSKEYEYQNGDTSTTESNSTGLDDTEYVFNEENSKDSITDSTLLEDEDAVSFANSIKSYIERYANGSTSSSTNSSSSRSGTNTSRNSSSSSSTTNTNRGNSSITTNNSSDTAVEANVTVSYVRVKKYDHKKERTQEQTVTTTVQNYVAQTPKNNYKVSKDDGEINFVTILCKKSHKGAKKFITSECSDWLFEILEKNPDTINKVELTRYLLNKVTNSDKFGKIDDTLLDSLFGGSSNFNGTSIVNGDIDVSDESNFITDVETLKKAFSGYSNSAKLIEHAQDFLDMQEKYKVNALFAAAVSIAETGAGNAGNAIKIATAQNSVGATIGVSWNNWFNIKASSTPYGILYNGEGESHYKIYSTVSASIDNFGNNIANGSYYYKQGKYTVNEIGHTYCPNSEAYPTQGDDWVEHTLTYINNFYSAAGITVESLTAGSFVQYYQGDYSNVPYGSSNLAACGCGPTSFAMIASTLLGQSITPEDAVTWCGNRYYVSNQGTSWSYFAAAASHFGLNVTVNQTSSINDAITALKNGKYVISSQGPGLFTSGGHYIVLAGIDENNNITVKDPNKNNAVTKGYNNRTFTSAEINQAAKQYWIFN